MTDGVEWRVFVPVAEGTVLAPADLGQFFSGLAVVGDGDDDSVEERSDVYVVVNDDIGLKKRGSKKQRLELKVRLAAHEGPPHGMESWTKHKIKPPKGDAADAHDPMTAIEELLQTHGLLNDQVKEAICGSKGRVEVAKQRLNAQHPDGVQLEEAVLQAGGKQWRSIAVEGPKDQVESFLSASDLGKSMYALTSQPGAIVTGYPGWVARIHQDTP